jgi:Ca2+-binding RTX toxin-like protein
VLVTTSFYGDAGNDTLDGGVDNDTLDGGEGFDFADYSSATGGVTVDLLTQQDSGAASGAAGNDILVNIEGIIGSNFNDTLEGENGNNASMARMAMTSSVA